MNAVSMTLRGAAVVGAAGAAVALFSSPVQAVEMVSATDNCTTANAKTVHSNTVHGRKIELRANGSETCAWGRITGGQVGDEVWVDRSTDGGRTWQQLGYTKITSGTDAFTPAYDDVNKKMRACGKAGNRVEIACSIWW